LNSFDEVQLLSENFFKRTENACFFLCHVPNQIALGLMHDLKLDERYLNKSTL
jgi:hypothetical protein